MKPSGALSPRRAATISFIVAFLLAIIPTSIRAQGLAACEPSPTVKAALEQLRTDQTPQETSWQYREKNLSKVQGLLKEYPDDLFVQRAYIDRVYFQERDQLVADYKSRFERNRNDPKVAYLYGLTLLGRQSAEAARLFESALERAPNFPWPHLSLERIYSAPAFLDKEKAATHMRAFLAACPAAFEGYQALTRMDDRDLAKLGAEKLRPILQARTDPEAVEAYPTLWALEFKAHPPSEYDPLRKQTSEELKRLRGLKLEDKRQWYEALEEGYKLANDQKQADWAKDIRQNRFPHPWELAAMSKWEKDHKWPSPEEAPDKQRAFYSDLLKQTDAWLKERPNATFIWWERLDAMKHLDSVPAAEVKATIDKALKVAQSNAGPNDLDSGDYFTIADALSKKGLEPQRIVEMAKKGLDRLEIEQKFPQYDLNATKDNTEDNNFWRASEHFQGLELETDGYLKLKETDKAQSSLAKIDDRLRNLRSLIGGKASRTKEYLGHESAYWGLRARMAELQNRKIDAMAYYESALLARFQAEQKPVAGEKDELADNAQKLWNELGGSEEGWKTWYGRRADALANSANLTWEEANQPLPTFELADLHGKAWKMSDLHGKVTFLNFWASW